MKHIYEGEGDLRKTLETKLKPFFPIDNYAIDSVQGQTILCTVEKFINKKSKEYWQTSIEISNGKIDLDKSFDFSNAKKVDSLPTSK